MPPVKRTKFKKGKRRAIRQNEAKLAEDLKEADRFHDYTEKHNIVREMSGRAIGPKR